MNQSEFERREVHFSGHVQGVGFRYTTYRIAANHRVTGFVQNLPDRRVKLVVEGTPDEIDAFVGSIHATMGNYIQDVHTSRGMYSGEFGSFEIKR